MNANGANPIRITDNPSWDGWASFIPVDIEVKGDK